MLVYKLLGQSAVDAFARSFGISYALNQVTEWQDIVTEVIKAILVMLILERLLISPPASWMEEHIDYLSVQVRSSFRLRPPVHDLFSSAPPSLPGGDDATETKRDWPHPRASQILAPHVLRVSEDWLRNYAAACRLSAQ